MLICSWHRAENRKSWNPGCCPAWPGPQRAHLLCLLLPVPLSENQETAELSFVYVERAKVDGFSSSVRTRHRNKLAASREGIFSTGKRNEAGRKSYVRFDSLLQLFRKLEGAGEGQQKGRRERKADKTFLFILCVLLPEDTFYINIKLYIMCAHIKYM